MRLRHVSGFIALSALLAAGCGGGAGGGTTVPTATDFSFGELSGRAAVSNPPVSTSSAGVVATAFTGTFSSLKIRELNPSLSETRIVAASDLFGGSYGIISCAVDGSDPQKITPVVSGIDDTVPSVSANGKAFFQRTIAGSSSIQMVNLDGSGLTQMIIGTSPSTDAAADKFAYLVTPSQINVMAVATRAVTAIVIPNSASGATVACFKLSADGSTVYFVESLGGSEYFYSVPADGSNAGRQIASLGAVSVLSMAVSQDGTEASMIMSGNPATLVRIGTGLGDETQPINLLSTFTAGLSYGPDGKELVLGMIEAGGGAAGLYINTIGSTSFSRITPLTSETFSPSWMGFTKDRTLISSGGGLLGTRACGVIQAQRSDQSTSSVLAFDVTTPSSVVMTAQPIGTLTSNSLVFSVDADSITKLSYANTNNWRGIRAIGPSTPVLSANGALVSIDGTTGFVDTVLPFNGTRAAGSHPTVTDDGSTRTFSGSFLAVYDKAGKNIAPNGASVVKLDTKTNAITIQN